MVTAIASGREPSVLHTILLQEGLAHERNKPWPPAAWPTANFAARPRSGWLQASGRQRSVGDHPLRPRLQWPYGAPVCHHPGGRSPSWRDHAATGTPPL